MTSVREVLICEEEEAVATARRAEEFDESASRLLDGREDDGEGEQFDASANFIRVTDDQ